MNKWKLYWVTSDGLEDCFVVAKNSRSAKRIEKDANGFEDQEVQVTRIMDIPDEYEMLANSKFRDWSKKHDYNKYLDIVSLNFLVLFNRVSNRTCIKISIRETHTTLLKKSELDPEITYRNNLR